MAGQLKTLPSRLQSHAGDVEVGPCLSDDDILAFVQGELPDHRRERIHVHVDQCNDCRRLLAETAHSLDEEPTAESGRTSWNTVFQPNSLVGKRYRILRLVARGGMGEVYEANDTMLHERVALKTVTSTACDSARAVRHLKAEVQLARRITHPNICRIYDLGTHVMELSGAEISFLVMEFVEGECLGKKLRTTGALSLPLAQAIAQQLLMGLRAAHLAGILHRDLKSENVILRTDSNCGINAVILDFGLAKALNESGSTTTTQGQGQSIVGTVGYMAPEQIEGLPLSRASDIYAFGVVWYEMLTGRLPFEAGSPAASAIARLHRDAEPPSGARPDVPGWLDEIVLRCLSRQRASRYSDAQQVLDALSTATTQHICEPIAALPQRHRHWLLGAVVLCMLLLITIAAKWGVMRSTSRSTVSANLEKDTTPLAPQPVPPTPQSNANPGVAVSKVQSESSTKGTRATIPGRRAAKAQKTFAATPVPIQPISAPQPAPSAVAASATPVTPASPQDRNTSAETKSFNHEWLPLR